MGRSSFNSCYTILWQQYWEQFSTGKGLREKTMETHGEIMKSTEVEGDNQGRNRHVMSWEITKSQTWLNEW